MSRDHFTDAERIVTALDAISSGLVVLNDTLETQPAHWKQIEVSAERSERQLLHLAERVRMLEKHAELEQRASDMALEYLLSNYDGVFIRREPNGQAVAYVVMGEWQLNSSSGYTGSYIRSAHAEPGQLDKMALIALARYVQAERLDEFAGHAGPFPVDVQPIADRQVKTEDER